MKVYRFTTTASTAIERAGITQITHDRALAALFEAFDDGHEARREQQADDAAH